MLGIGFSKLVVLVAIVVAVWYGFRWIERLRNLGEGRGGRGRVRHRSRDPYIVDLERNPKTGAYEPRRRDD